MNCCCQHYPHAKPKITIFDVFWSILARLEGGKQLQLGADIWATHLLLASNMLALGLIKKPGFIFHLKHSHSTNSALAVQLPSRKLTVSQPKPGHHVNFCCWFSFFGKVTIIRRLEKERARSYWIEHFRQQMWNIIISTKHKFQSNYLKFNLKF